MSVINHVNVVTRDLKGTADFFKKNFGFEADPAVDLDGPWVAELTGYPGAKARYIKLKAPGGGAGSTNIELLTYLTPETPAPPNSNPELDQPGYRHIAFVVDDIEAMYDKLKDEWRFFSPPVTAEADGKKLKTVYFVGPEGIIVQLLQPLAG